MPELPEVETIRAGLAPALVGRRIIDAGSHPSEKFLPARATGGATITGLRRRGKYLLVDLDGEQELVVHLGMTGRLAIRREPPVSGCDDRTSADSADSAGPSPYRRAWWRLDDGNRLELVDVRRFGRLAVVPAGDHATVPTLARLGPEPLGADFGPDPLWRAVRASRARLKTQLLSQRPVAGLGNIYADEALWHARLSPTRRTLSRPEALRLHRAIRRVLIEGLINGGTTLRDYRDATGGRGRNQDHLACYGRAGEPCRRCGEPLTRRVLDGRATTWCRACVRRPAPAGSTVRRP